MSEAEGFFARWSRRKAQARAGVPLPEPAGDGVSPDVGASAAPAPEPTTPPGCRNDAASAQTETPVNVTRTSAVAPDASAPPERPLPTLEDVQRLTPDADFRPFVDRRVAPEVRNAALRKLFADPHFNVMDGLDVYIDDYSRPDPLPTAMLRNMVAARFMKLIEEAEPTAPGARATPAADGGASHPTDGDMRSSADPVPPPSAALHLDDEGSDSGNGPDGADGPVSAAVHRPPPQENPTR